MKDIENNLEQSVDITINMTKTAMFKFMMINSFKSMGILIWGISFVALILLPVSIFMNELKVAAVMGIIVFMNFISKPIRFKRNAHLQIERNDTFKHPIKYSFNSEGVFISQFVGDGNITWDHFIRVVDRGDLILLYITDSQAFIIIKNQIQKDEIESIKKIVRNVKGLKHNI